MGVKTAKEWADRQSLKMVSKLNAELVRCKDKIADEKGQGTAEYAILIAVVVVAAVVLVVAFGDKLAAIWTNANGQMATVQSYTSPHA